MKLKILLIVSMLAACGGGSDGRMQPTIAFYGDSITAGRPVDIAAGDFLVQDFAVPAKDSDAPLSQTDISTITVLRYGMADIVHGIPPEITRNNLIILITQIKAKGRKPVVVNVNATETGIEKKTNDSLSDITDIDVSDIKGNTVDGIHPDEAFHQLLNMRIHDGLIKLF